MARFLTAERLLLADDMGLGKTVQAAAACHALHRSGHVQRGLVITPASLKGQWKHEWNATTKIPVAVVDGSPADRARAYVETTDGFLIVNYEQLLRDLDEILAWDPQIVVLDEAQRIKNWATKTATYVKRLEPRYRLVLTGTPMENRLEELASIMDWVDDHALEPKWRLAPLHSVSADGAREVVGARHLGTLRERLAPSLLRRVRSDVLSQLPPRDALLRSLSSPKLAEARALLSTLAIEQGRKVVVFSQWRRMLQLVHWAVGDLLDTADVQAMFLTGRESSRRRTRNLVEFHDDPNARILFASDAGGVGLNLQRAASACVLLDLPWNPAVLEQRVGRIYRLGQKHPIDVYSLVSSDSIEERIASLVADKRALFRGLFDGTGDDVRFERSGSFLDKVSKLIGNEGNARAVSPEADELADKGEEAAEGEFEAWLREEEKDVRADYSGTSLAPLPHSSTEDESAQQASGAASPGPADHAGAPLGDGGGAHGELAEHGPSLGRPEGEAVATDVQIGDSRANSYEL